MQLEYVYIVVNKVLNWKLDYSYKYYKIEDMKVCVWYCNACGVLCAEVVACAHSPTHATVKPNKLTIIRGQVMNMCSYV